MARHEHAGSEAQLASTEVPFFELGMMHASGRSGTADLVAAHKWFNLAAMRGDAEAVRLRHEIAREMSSAEIGRASCRERVWIPV